MGKKEEKCGNCVLSEEEKIFLEESKKAITASGARIELMDKEIESLIRQVETTSSTLMTIF